MERFWKAALAICGIGALGFFVFWSLYQQWLSLPIFEKLDKKQTFILMLLFLAFTFLALVSAIAFRARHKAEADDVLALFDRLRDGLASPKENVGQIERIANSRDPKKLNYLRLAAGLPQISFLEGDAITLALDDISTRKPAKELLLRARSKELERIEAAIPPSADPLFRSILLQAKYWRYVNRKDHPSFQKMNRFIGVAVIKGPADEETLDLSRQLEEEFRSAEHVR